MKRFVCTVALVVVIFVTLPLSTLVAQATGSFASLPSGHAYVAYTTPAISGVINSGSVIAPAGITCTKASTASTNQVANIAVGSLVDSGSANTVVTNTQTATSGTIQSSVTVQNVSLLAGLVRATKLQAMLTSTASASGANTTVKQASFSGLSIAGIPLLYNPAPNTKLSLVGLGSVTLNEQSLSNGSTSSNGSVNMIDIHVTVANNLIGLPVNTQIIVGHVDSSETIEPAPGTAQAESYGLFAGVSSQVILAPVAPAYTGCAGGSGQSNVTSKTYSFGSAGVITDTASGSITSSSSTASAQSTISEPNLLGGLIKANLIVSKANASFGTTGSVSSSVTFSNLTIGGVAQSNNPAPNTSITLPGLGYATLNEQAQVLNSTAAIVSEYAIDIHITTAANIFGLGVGARIVIGASVANVSK